MPNKNVESLKTELAIKFANFVKGRSGRGPAKTEVSFFGKYIVIEIQGYLSPQERELATTEAGYFDVKLMHTKFSHLAINNFVEQVSGLIGKKIDKVFYDVDPLTDTGVHVFIFE